jgi:hypothetical protein
MLTVQLAAQVVARGDTAEMLRLAAYSESQFVYYANQVPVIFAYKLADNDENRRRGIAGRNSGFRQGVRNLNYVPAGQHPAGGGSAQPLGSTIRYYDKGRQKWRSYRKGNLLTITAFWSEELQTYVDTPEEAGIARGVPFEAAPRGSKPQVDEARAARSEARAQARRGREADRERFRTNDRTARATRKRTNATLRSAR